MVFLDWMIGFIAPYTFTHSGLLAILRYHHSTNFQFTIAHALGLSVFTSCILTMDLSQSHCNFKSHMKSSCHSLIPFLPLFYKCQLNSIVGWCLKLDSVLLTTMLGPVKSKSHCDWWSVDLSWCWAPFGSHDHILVPVWQLLSCSYGMSSLTRGWVCHLSKSHSAVISPLSVCTILSRIRGSVMNNCGF
jgi:hypothetical protein